MNHAICKFGYILYSLVIFEHIETIRIRVEIIGQVTLVAMGPLTNVALAFSTDEELPSKIKEIFIMGGNVEGVGNCPEEGFSACAEFNFGADPEAAYVVLDRAACPTHIAPIELCTARYSNVPMEWRKVGFYSQDQIAARINSPEFS